MQESEGPPRRPDDTQRVHCHRCGTRAPSEPPPLGWSGGTERGRPVWVCERCTRDNLRSIEGKLSPDWW
ncbi:hypothetical protein [Thalassiella azotivora]